MEELEFFVPHKKLKNSSADTKKKGVEELKTKRILTESNKISSKIEKPVARDLRLQKDRIIVTFEK